MHLQPLVWEGSTEDLVVHAWAGFRARHPNTRHAKTLNAQGLEKVFTLFCLVLCVGLWALGLQPAVVRAGPLCVHQLVSSWFVGPGVVHLFCGP